MKILLAVLALTPIRHQEGDPEELFRKWEGALQKVRSLELRFSAAALSGREQDSFRGTLALAEGNRVRLQVDGGSDDGRTAGAPLHRFLSDGHTLSAETTPIRTPRLRKADPELSATLSSHLARLGVLLTASLLKEMPLSPPSEWTRTVCVPPDHSSEDPTLRGVVFELRGPFPELSGQIRASVTLWFPRDSDFPVLRETVVLRDGSEIGRGTERYEEWKRDADIDPASFRIPDEDLIRDVFERYRKALLDADGAAALGAVDEATVEWYDAVLADALRVGRADLDERSLTQRFTILRLRIAFNRSELAAKSGREILAHAVREGWIGRSGVERAELGRLRVDGERAGATIQGGPDSVDAFVFTRKDGRWRVSIVESMVLAEAAFERMRTQSGLSEEEFLLQLLSRVSRTQVDASVFEGPRE